MEKRINLPWCQLHFHAKRLNKPFNMGFYFDEWQQDALMSMFIRINKVNIGLNIMFWDLSLDGREWTYEWNPT